MIGGPQDRIRGLKYWGVLNRMKKQMKFPSMEKLLHAGDLKYEDKNDDGVVDDNDNQPIGHTTPKLYYALNLKLAYK